MDKDEYDENSDDTEEDDEIGDDTEEDDKIGGDTASKDKEEYDTKGVKPVPTVDELYPDDDPADHARWYQELHQPRPRTPHIRTIGKKNPNIFRMFLMRSMAMRSSANFTSMRVDLCPWSGPTTTWTSPAPP